MRNKQRSRCRRCVWNNVGQCGTMFCMLPRCVVAHSGEVKRHGR